MEITSLYFILLSVLSIFVFYLLKHNYRNQFITFISLAFIATYSYYLVIYVIFYSFVNYWLAIKIPGSRFKKSIFLAGIILNISQLILLKYVSFTINPLFRFLAIDIDVSHFSRIIIPVGVSFFTLQGIGYLINIKLGWEKPERNFIHFLLYIIFFPRFLSGPIDRSNHFLPQLKLKKPLDQFAGTPEVYIIDKERNLRGRKEESEYKEGYNAFSVSELSNEMQVSGVTIRKDLKLLEDKNLLFRILGGGSINNPYKIEKPINEKELINVKEKQQIAKTALTLIGDNDSIIIGSGTTVFELARCLHPPKTLTVITPALNVAMELSNRPNVEVLQLGGMLRPDSSSVAGPFAENILEDISCGILFLGVDGIDLRFGLSITNLAETTLDQKMMVAAQSTVILADSTKFGQRGVGRICSLEQIQYIITDEGISKEMVNKIEERGVRIIIAK